MIEAISRYRQNKTANPLKIVMKIRWDFERAQPSAATSPFVEKKISLEDEKVIEQV